MRQGIRVAAFLEHANKRLRYTSQPHQPLPQATQIQSRFNFLTEAVVVRYIHQPVTS
jgi:hypothetical protein